MAEKKRRPVGFKLPSGTRSNAKNLLQPGYVIDPGADPWTLCKDPWINFPMPDKQVQFNQLICRRYGNPRPPDPLPHYGQTAMHITDFEAALQLIAQKDPGWFKQQGYGPGPSGTDADGMLFPTQTESHDAQYAFNLCTKILNHAKELGLAG